ncbi:MAG: hypothetical protein N2322_07195 [Terrimicrobiaceae bacterium]|nr:hypothetical protein [Terrimicrobiaceae bacterium]
MRWRYLPIGLLLLGLSGGHWAFLQTVAWSDMVVRYAAVDGWLRGVIKTFSGEAPCHLCKKIASSSQDERKPSAAAGASKIELFRSEPPLTLPERAENRAEFFAADFRGLSRGDPPPVPPPLSA